MIISRIRVHKLYYNTRDLFSSTSSQVYYKKKREQVNVIPFYKSAMDLNTFLFETTLLKIGDSQVGQNQVVYMYVPSSISVIMASKDQKVVSNPFLFHRFENNVRAGKPQRCPQQQQLVLLDLKNKKKRQLKKHRNYQGVYLITGLP